MPDSYQIGPDTHVTLSYSAFDAEGDAVSEANSRIEFVFGRGQLLPAIEMALDGLSPGDCREIELTPKEGFGRRDPDRVLEVSREEFPDDVAAGDRFEVENEAGHLLVLQVLDVGPDTVHVDMNHPLAGQQVRLRLEVAEVRPATQNELDEADAALTRVSSRPLGAEAEAPLQLVGVDRLLRGPAQSYEKGPAEAPDHPTKEASPSPRSQR